MDDLEISHKDPAVVTDIIWQLNDKYGKITPIVSTCRKIHEYFSMTTDFLDISKVKIIMYNYVDEMIGKFPTKMIGKSANPASNHLLESARIKMMINY